LAAAFAAFGVIFLLDLTLPGAVTAFAGVQALWWLAAAITLMVRGGEIPNGRGEKGARLHQRSNLNPRSLQIDDIRLRTGSKCCCGSQNGFWLVGNPYLIG